MDNRSINVSKSSGFVATEALGYFLFCLFVAIGIINVFWGNDVGFGIFIVLLSLIFLPGTSRLVKTITGYRIHWAVKLFVALFILWAALGVGELFDKIEMMTKQLS